MSRIGAALVLSCASLVFLAGGITASSAEAQQAPSDELRLHDGGFLRGTIVEMNSTELTFQLVTGEVRTYPMSEVESVGPALVPAPTPPSPAPPAPISAVPTGIHLRVESEQQELSLHRLTNSTRVTVATYSNGQASSGTAIVDQYAPICNAPCDVTIPAGTFVLGVAQGGGQPQRIGRPVALEQDTRLAIAYDDRSLFRAMGWLGFGLGMAGGTAMLLPALLSDPFDVPLLVGASVTYGVGFILYAAFAFFNDAPSVEVLSPDGVRF